MRQLRFLAFAVISFVAALFGALLSPSTWLHKSLAVALCGVLSANPALCTNNAIAVHSQEASATNPVKVETTKSNNLLSDRSREFLDDTPPSIPQQINNPSVNRNNSQRTQNSANANRKLDLNGEWLFETAGGKGSSTRRFCYEIPKISESMKIQQSNNQISLAVTRLGKGSYAPFLTSNKASLSGDRVEWTSDFRFFYGSISSDGTKINGFVDGIRECGLPPTPFVMTRKGSAVCNNSPNVKRTFTTSASPDKKRVQSTSNLNEKFSLEIVNPKLFLINYTDCKGSQWLFKAQNNGVSSQSGNFVIGLKSKLSTKDLTQPSEQQNQIAELIDPVISVGCGICEMLSAINAKIDAAMRLDSVINSDISKVNSATNIARSLFKGKIPDVNVFYRNPINDAARTSLESVIEKKIESLPDKEILKPLKDYTANLSTGTFGCTPAFQGTCAARSNDKPPELPIPQPLTIPDPFKGLKEGDECPAGLRNYTPPPEVTGCYLRCWFNQVTYYCPPAEYGKPSSP